MKLSLLSVAYPFAPVSSQTAGGAEQILLTIDRELAERGHRSTVIACEGSCVAGTLIPVPRVAGDITEEARAAVYQHVREAIQTALAETRIDVIHMHGIDFVSYLPAGEVPVLVTLHLPPEWYPAEVFHLARPNTFLHCVSESQRLNCPPCDALLPTIENGVDLEAFRPLRRKKNFVAALGRICPEKGYHLALDAAADAGVACVLAGEVYPYREHREYYEREVAPRLDGCKSRFIGAVDNGRKRRLLASARCLLVPSLARETSSLVAMEALACGTGVVSFPSGALADLVDDGKTGFLVRNEREMSAAIQHADEIDAATCRSTAEARFSAVRMVDQYLKTYTSLAAQVRVNGHLQCRTITDADELFAMEQEWTALYNNCTDATPFQSPQWLHAWWSVFGGAVVEAITIRNAGQLVGLLPLYRYEGRQYTFGNGISDYLDCLARSDVEAAVAEEVWQHLGPCDLRDLPPGSALIRYAPERFRNVITDDSHCFVMDPRSVHLPSKLLRNLRGERRKLQQVGEVAIETAGADAADEYLEELFRLQQARWSTRTEPAVLRDPALQRFHRVAAERLARTGMLEFHGLRVDGQLRAVLYTFVRNGRTYYYMGGFDPSLARYGPGSLLIHHAIVRAASAGHAEFDFMRGDEPYKMTWGAESRHKRRIVLRSMT